MGDAAAPEGFMWMMEMMMMLIVLAALVCMTVNPGVMTGAIVLVSALLLFLLAELVVRTVHRVVLGWAVVYAEHRTQCMFLATKVALAAMTPQEDTDGNREEEGAVSPLLVDEELVGPTKEDVGNDDSGTSAATTPLQQQQPE